MDRLSDGYLVRTNESLYSVQSMANIRIQLIFDSSNTLVNRLGPRVYGPGLWLFIYLLMLCILLGQIKRMLVLQC